jgi:hypothetical protein
LAYSEAVSEDGLSFDEAYRKPDFLVAETFLVLVPPSFNTAYLASFSFY